MRPRRFGLKWSTPKPRIIHYYARYLKEASGPTSAIDSWAGLTADQFDTHVWTASGHRIVSSGRRPMVYRIPHIGFNRATWLPYSAAWRLKQDDIVYLHEGWVFSNLCMALICKFRRVPYIVMPHGVYEPAIVANTRDVLGIRRRLEQFMLQGAARVHVFYQSETTVVNDIAPGLDLHYIVLPNGTPDILGAVGPSREDYILWMGRFDVFHKGLDNLLRRWSELPAPRPTLKMVGPDFNGGRKEVYELIDTLDLGDAISVGGAVDGEQKEKLFNSARAYIHSSRWESCSITLLEALGHGVPCIVSSSIHAVDELLQRGLVVDVDMEAAGSLKVALERTANESETLATRSTDWAKNEGSWARIGETYRSIIATFIMDMEQLRK